MTLKLNAHVIIPENEIVETFIRSSGPGGQNVNKVSSAVQLRFNIKNSQVLPPEIKERLLKNLHHLLTKEGDIVITAQASRNQKDNRELARIKLISLLRKAIIVPKKRIKTKPSKTATEKRLNSKTKHGLRKKLRGKIQED